MSAPIDPASRMPIQPGEMELVAREPDLPPNASVRPATMPTSRLFFWSIRRELWQHRGIVSAPLWIAGIVLLAMLVAPLDIPNLVREFDDQSPERQTWLMSVPFDLVARILRAISFFIGIGYCVDALYSERRDRSILFWKSLPVSNAVTVLSKALVPFVVLPVVTVVAIVATELMMLLIGTARLAISGEDASLLWTQVPLIRIWMLAAYTAVTLTLWHAPLYGWLLLVSAWARKAPFAWAILPVVVLGIVEAIVFRSASFLGLIKARVLGGLDEALAGIATGRSQATTGVPDPWEFFMVPGVWIGITIAAAFIFAAVWLRRRGEPI